MILFYIYRVLSILLTVYSFALIIYIFMSWVPNARESSFGRVLASLCEPYLEPFRRIIPPLGMIDISPIVAIFILRFADAGLLAVFRMLGAF
ncbi:MULTISPECIES: YggT family protein [Bacillus]|uniref:YggT family protein n=1 Tax=Bacillus TaxID=1386 RepID=UPI00080D9A6A|nr:MULTISPECIES: YggT family protein [Bacillus]MCJ2145536.1 YggT family protein [Bacillus sp. B19-2]MDE1382270.1 YggT family protein [Bacillus paralicheniformis]MDN5387953.1 YggT family protein [Bacillus sp. LB7]MEC1021496.1 YggT family protein [Bacillus paralicheniformis]MEC1028093.1 YggT family protein [Bacillus paralicheniformis]